MNNFKGFPYGPLKKVTAGAAGPYELWRMNNFSPADLGDPASESTIWGDLADPDMDGLINLLEYALAGDPNIPDAGTVMPQLTRSGNVLTLSYTMHRSDLAYQVLTNTVLQGQAWSATGVSQVPDPDTAPEGTLIEASVTLGEERRFLQLEVVQP